MRTRLSLVACLMLAIVGLCLAGDVSGPVPRGQDANRAPVHMGAYAQPSALASPIAAGKQDYLTTDGQGSLRVFDRGGDLFRTLTLTNVSQPVKASQGVVSTIALGNPNTNTCWVHLYNTANASVTVGTTTPVASYMVGANATLVVPGSADFSTAISIACTNVVNDDQGPANNVTATVYFK